MPAGRWVMRQSWCDLLFAHWRVPASALRPWIPEVLKIQEFDGSAWLGAVPFRMSGVMYRPLPDLPWISAFPELNLRTYVEHDGKPGVWFFSLDATNPLAVWAARRFFHLPYFQAAIQIQEGAQGYSYSSVRREKSLTFRARYRPTSNVFASSPGSLEAFLTEHYCLYAQSPSGPLLRSEVHHAQWPLQHAEAEIHHSDLHLPHNLPIQGPPELLHFSKHLDVIIWPPQQIAT
ncbi:MAG TPA: DUF2071 domain-containing protein [Polyangiaceae bacterium]|nr:DUF2071 domain-containing protein [Polyangiaceae bacterium]